MKKLIMIITALLTFSTITACSSTPATETAAPAKAEAAATPSATTTPRPKTNVFGEVIEVVGNSVTLKMIERAQKNLDTATADPAATPKTGGGPGTGDGSGGGSGSSSAEARVYTGEEKEIIIPVGIALKTRLKTAEGSKEVDMELNQIKVGNVMTILYKEDGTTIDKIIVTTGTAAQ